MTSKQRDKVSVVEFLAPAKLMSLNDRMHWRRRADATKWWRTRAAWAAREARVRQLPRSLITVELPVRDSRRRDPHNYLPTVKAIIDGLVDAGVWPDDNPTWVAVTEPRLVPKATVVRVLLTPIREAMA